MSAHEPRLLERQRALADFADLVIRSNDLAEVLTEACRLLADALGMRRARILRIEDGGETLRVRAGVGWSLDGAAEKPLPLGVRSAERFALAAGEPVLCRDILEEARFEAGEAARHEGIRALALAPILLPGGAPYGLLQADDAQPRAFTGEDGLFLRLHATLLGPVIDRLQTVERLREVEDRDRRRETGFRTIFDTAPVGMSVIGLDGRFLRVNREIARILGRSQEELLSLSVADVTDGADAERSLVVFRQSLETGRTASLDKNYRRPAGELVPANSSLTPLLLDDGSAAVLAVTIDLTARHEAEQILRQSEERYRLILENALDYAIFTVDWDGIVTSWPAGAEAVFGWSAAEMIGQDMAITFTQEDRANDEPRWERETALREGVAPNVRWHLRKDGRRIFIDGSARPLPRSGGGFIKIGQDVTERREAEKQLRENRRRLWTMIQGIPQLVWRAADAGHWTWASPQWGRYTGQTPEQSQGLGWLDALHPDDREPAVAGWRQSDGVSHLDMETRLFHAEEQRYRWFQTRALPVRDEEGRIVEWVGTSTDIDDMRQLQERQQVLLAELQHRTRNLLGVVRSIADRTAVGATSVADFLPLFSERLSALSRINGLLSKLEQGRRVAFDDLLRSELDARGVLGQGTAKRVVLEGPLGIRLRSASVQTFALAIHELTTNAVKYGALSGREGRLKVLWHVVRNDDNKQHLHVEWIESGVAGMPGRDDPAKGGGYGRELIERALPYQLHARTTYEIGADGVRCTIDLPLG